MLATSSRKSVNPASCKRCSKEQNLCKPMIMGIASKCNYSRDKACAAVQLSHTEFHQNEYTVQGTIYMFVAANQAPFYTLLPNGAPSVHFSGAFAPFAPPRYGTGERRIVVIDKWRSSSCTIDKWGSPYHVRVTSRVLLQITEHLS